MATLVKKLLSCGAKSFLTAGAGAGRLPEKGHVWVCVGTERPRRFELEAGFLNHPLLEELLHLSAGEFGYSYHGALRIACEADLFLQLLRTTNPSVHCMAAAAAEDCMHDV